MRLTQTGSYDPKPVAFIAINKNRLKFYKTQNDPQSVYLKDKQEFQIEIFNPTQKVVLAEFYINGERMQGGGLVLRPAERVFLDRYLTENKKLLFSTYDVSGSRDEIAHAIAKNGNITVKFYDEIQQAPVVNIYNYQTKPFGGNDWFCGGTGSPVYGGTITTNSGSLTTNSGSLTTLLNGVSTFTSNICDDNISSLSFSTDMNMTKDIQPKSRSFSKNLRSKSVETGRIEKGSESSQTFNYVDKSFSCWCSAQVDIKILPISTKIETSDSVSKRKYCSECGSKSTSATAKFCSHCGTKL